jgi:DNA-binding MarR family transcriptional regulator
MTDPGETAAAPAATEQHVAEEIVAVIGEALSEIKCIGSERMARTGLSMTHWHLLLLLARHGEMSMGRLAEAQGISLSNASGLVDRLDERGLIERVRVPDDRRIVLVRVSDRGREQLAAVDLLREELVHKIIGRLDERQLNRLAAALRDLRSALTATLREDPDPVLREHLDSYAHAVTRDRQADVASGRVAATPAG